MLDWIEDHGGGRRNKTRVEKNYHIGSQYLRDRDTHGGDRKGAKIKSNFFALDRAADRLARKFRCSHQHVKNSARFARHLDPDTRFRQWWRRAKSRQKLKEGKDFVFRLKSEPKRNGCGRTAKDYLLTANAAKRVAASDSSDKGRAILRALMMRASCGDHRRNCPHPPQSGGSDPGFSPNPTAETCPSPLWGE